MFPLLLVLFVLVAAPVEAQPKALGTFGAECDAPSWSSFGSLAEWDDFAAAAVCSRDTGRRWVLQLHGPDDVDDLRPHVSEVRWRAAKAGLAPHVVALTLREEWYEHFRHGLLRSHPRFGVYRTAGVEGIDAIRDWLTVQHAGIRQRWPGVPVAWITTFVNPTRAYGDHLYAPLPGGVDVLVLDPYATAGQSFEDWPEQVFAHAVAVTSLPIAIVPQWFAQPGTTFGPRPDLSAGFARWLRHDRVIAGMGFTWASRPGLVGLRDLPDVRAAAEASMRAAGLIR